MEIHVLTVFPQFYRTFLKRGLLAKARERGALELRAWSLRRFTPDDYGEIDDRAYGGEFGMVMKPEPYFRGVEHIRETRGEGRVLLMAPDGERFDNQAARELSSRDRLIFLTGRYEGVDHRVRSELADETWSVGSYVTPGGDLPALTLVSAVVRHCPGVISNRTSVRRDSYQDGRLAPPHYTRPREYRGLEVPEVLRSGDHEKIRRWREEEALDRTRRNRPGLLENASEKEHRDDEAPNG